LLAEDCADLDPDALDEAAREWAKTEPFMPRACELRERALQIIRARTRGRILPAPKYEPPAQPVPDPLTDEEIARLPQALLEMGVRLGEIDAERAARIRSAA